MRDKDGVLQERTGWRDLELSQRHRKWGYDCPAQDIDFLMIEYDTGKAVALVEYKHEKAKLLHPAHPSRRALVDLGNRASLPVFGVRYAENFSWWKVTPANKIAKKWITKQTVMTEEEYVKLLYEIRQRKLPAEIFSAKQKAEPHLSLNPARL